MITQHTTQYIRDLNSLYDLLHVVRTKGRSDYLLEVDDLPSCPCCNSKVEGFQSKTHTLTDFPYFTEDMRFLFYELSTTPKNLDEMNQVLRIHDAHSAFRFHLRPVNTNHNRAQYSYPAFQKYRKMIHKFKESPYFEESLLERVYDTNNSFLRLPDDIRFDTYYCDNCYDDIFTNLYCISHDKSKVLFEKRKQNMIQELDMETKISIYTLSAAAVAYIYCFSTGSHYRDPVELEKWVEKPYQFHIFHPFIKPTIRL